MGEIVNANGRLSVIDRSDTVVDGGTAIASHDPVRLSQFRAQMRAQVRVQRCTDKRIQVSVTVLVTDIGVLEGCVGIP